MKKIISIAILLVFVVTCSYAEELDYSSLTADELIGMRNQITAELNSRFSPDPSAIYSGNYIVGKDIKAGQYIFAYDKLAEGCTYGELLLYANEEARENRDEYVLENLRIGVEFYLNLVDGMIVEVNLGSGTLRATVTPEWAP